MHRHSRCRTLYNDKHLFHPNALNHYSLGTKNKNLKRNADGSLTLYVGGASPGQDGDPTGCPLPEGRSRFTFARTGDKKASPADPGSRRPSNEFEFRANVRYRPEAERPHGLRTG
ncbi:DUF1214 domain-containing protein [Noviluteimonas dokdonensis]|uniref:DUF1214 domain-containing protein n=1 Tax=Noviluteimonas dokdonensis TaxID=414050 RepID=UPI001929C52A